MIASVGHPEVIVVVHGEALRSEELSGCFTVPANFTNVVAFGVKFLDSIKITVIADVIIILRYLGQRP